MAGTWTSQNKILPGIYINFQKNTTLSIEPGSRGTVILLQEMSTGTVGDIYTISVNDTSEWPAAATDADKFLTGEALKNALTVKVYNLGTEHTAEVLVTALATLKTVDFDVLCYPYPAAAYATNQATVKTWVTDMVENEGVGIQAVMADYAGDYEYIINCAHGVELSGGTVLTNAQTCAWVAGATAGAGVNEDNTGLQYDGAIDVSPHMTRSAMETAITAGKFIFQVDNSQNVSATYDINSLTTYTEAKPKIFRKNRLVRLICGIKDDINTVFESNVKGKFNNNAEGQSYFKTLLAGYFLELQAESAIQNFSVDDLTVEAGTDTDAVVVTAGIQFVDGIDKVYMTVNLS